MNEYGEGCGWYEPGCEYCTPWQDASEEEKMKDPEATVSEAGEAICPMCRYLEVCCICETCDICGSSFIPIQGQVVMFCSDGCYESECNMMAEEHYRKEAMTKWLAEQLAWGCTDAV